MSGNVWEWMQDCWHSNYNGAPSDGSAWTNGYCRYYVSRGGSWSDAYWVMTSTNRGKSENKFRNLYVGFRLAQDIKEVSEIEKQAPKEEKIQTLLSGAQEDINAIRLTSPDGNNALEKYNKILELDSENTEAKQGLQTIVDKYIGLAQQAAGNGEYDKAIANLDKADKIFPDSENIKTVREEIGLKVKEEEEQRLAELEKQRQAGEKRLAKLEPQNKIDMKQIVSRMDLSNTQQQVINSIDIRRTTTMNQKRAFLSEYEKEKHMSIKYTPGMAEERIFLETKGEKCLLDALMYAQEQVNDTVNLKYTIQKIQTLEKYILRGYSKISCSKKADDNIRL